MAEIRIGSHRIGPNHPPFVVAELSGNHNGSLQRALDLVAAAKATGVHAIKLQTYTADTITLDIKSGNFVINDPTSLWKGRNLYDLYKEAHTPWEWHQPIFDLCKKLGLTVFSTPFDETAVDFLESLQVPCYKIASLEIVDLPLIRKVAKTGKPLIISTGGSTLLEIEEAVSAARQAGCKELILLKCTSAYPTTPSECNLRTMQDLAKKFNVPVGLSDHTLSLGVPIASIALGGCFIEKHLTLLRANGGVDSAFSLEPHEIKELVEESYKAWQALGKVSYEPLPSEKTSLSHRPSLYFVEDLGAGTVVESHHVRSLRPSGGLPPKDIDKVIGRRVSKDVKKGMPVVWDLL
ncbi:MAG: pseudaminic acid synthase [Parachlamydiaceae bacterium]|nr:pseudaminic acid synthase [Parachlamydiaceae bacterium]